MQLGVALVPVQGHGRLLILRLLREQDGMLGLEGAAAQNRSGIGVFVPGVLGVTGWVEFGWKFLVYR